MTLQWEAPKKDRVFEIRITDKTNKRVYAMDIKVPPNEVVFEQGSLRDRLLKGCADLVISLFRTGKIPEIPTQVVPRNELPRAEGAAKS